MKDLRIFNEVGSFRVPRKRLLEIFEKFCRKEKVGRDFDVRLVFVGKAQMKKLNEGYKGGDGATDVLSFDLENGEGEIYICVPVAAAFAKESGEVLSDEVFALFVHGLLHLKGHTHETDKKLADMLKRAGEVVGS